MNVAYNMDCLDYMHSLPGKVFDLCVADPPYGINVTGMHPATHKRRLSEEDIDHSVEMTTVYGRNKKAAAYQNFIPCSTIAPRRARMYSGS